MQRTAVLSDIHGNVEALEQVLLDLQRRDVERLVVLGDTVGYGPDPRACLERIAPRAQVLLIGNHEADLIRLDPDMDVDLGLREWTAAQLADSPAWQALRERATRLGVEPAATARVDGLHLVHAAPEAPVKQYIWPAHPCQYVVFNQQVGARLGEFLAQFAERLGCCGHTHVPAVLTDYANQGMFDPYEARLEWDRVRSFVSPQALFIVPVGSVRLQLPADGRLVINPGSVGQPRDGNADASYAILDDRVVELRRVPYDSAPTCAKLRALPVDEELRADLVHRLQTGE